MAHHGILLRYQVFLVHAAVLIGIVYTINQKDYGISNIIAQLLTIQVLSELTINAIVTSICNVAKLGEIGRAHV